MANRFIGGVVSSKPQANTPFVSRASTGTYFNSTGTLVTAPVNQPRLTYKYDGAIWGNPSLLIEPASTNKILKSSEFNNASYWELQNSTIASAAGIAPDGTNTACKIQENTNNIIHGVERDFGATNSLYYTLSVFAKAAERSWLLLDNTHQGVANYRNWFNLSNGTMGTMAGSNERLTMTAVGNGWYRCSVTRLAGTAGSHRVCIYATLNNDTLSYAGTNGSGILIWGAQLENTLGPTSYIPTDTVAVTRAADLVGPYSSGIYSLEDRQNTTATDDQFTVQSFTSTGSTAWTAPADVNSIEVLVVAGGGGGGFQVGGGGGAGGLVYNSQYPVTPGASYAITVGAGGAGSLVNNTGRTNGSNSVFGSITAIGGGYGACHAAGATTGRANSGGSGGGGAGTDTLTTPLGGLGVASQGNAGGIGRQGGDTWAGGGGGGAGAPGSHSPTAAIGGNGGTGLQFSISGTATYYAGGGGGCCSLTSGPSLGGLGGGGRGFGNNGQTFTGTTAGEDGVANTGGGGGGVRDLYNNALSYSRAGNGGSGIVVVRYKRVANQLTSTSNAAVVTQKFITSNVWTAPVGVTRVEALVVAGGGGGGNGTGGGGGGAGGVVYSSTLSVTPGTSYTIGVGSGGNGATDAAALPAYNGTGSGIAGATELITNGSNFTTGTGTTGWSATTATLSVPQNGVFQILPNIAVNGTASQSITTVNGSKYLLVIKIIQDAAKLVRVRIGTTQLGSDVDDRLWTNNILTAGASGTGTYSTVFTAVGTTTWINLQIGNGTGQVTQFSSISVRETTTSAFGGGAGGSEGGTGSQTGNSGGSGGGGRYANAGSAGIAGQGNAGGAGFAGVANLWTGGGGGGAAAVGGTASAFYPGYGGAGVGYAITGNLEYYGGGGGGSSQNNGVGTVYPGLGGIGGGGTGFADQTSSVVGKGINGAPNTGGGGGAQANEPGSGSSGHGGSGVVVLRYRVPQVATFLDSGTWTCPTGVTSVQALVVAGGGGAAGGNAEPGGGGGAGGLIYSTSVNVSPGITYPIEIGQGGVGTTNARQAASGNNSSFAGLVAIGGGSGGYLQTVSGRSGGSGGGGSGWGGGAGANPGTGTYGQGNNGGAGNVVGSPIPYAAGGGGGAGGNGFAMTTGTSTTGGGGNGGVGLQFSISGTATYYAGGGAGSSYGGAFAGTGGLGGGANGVRNADGSALNGLNGSPNTGGGASGAIGTGLGGTGGSGIVILRWYGA